MPRPQTEQIIVLEDNTDRGKVETHPSWILIRFNTVSHGPPGADLFDSEISHQHTIQLTITRCERRRHLNRDWFHATETILEARMSANQFGAIVSSFGKGTGVPATLEYLDGVQMPSAPVERRLDESHREVKDAGKTALAKVQAAEAALAEAYERKAGRKELTPLFRDLHFAIRNAPANMEFAAESLTEHVEKVVTKARGDIEGMVLNAIAMGRSDAEIVGGHDVLELEARDGQ